MKASASRLRLVWRVLVLMLAVCGALVGFASSAAASRHGKSGRTLILHPKFQWVRGSYLVASDRYVFISGSSFPAGDGVLIDGRTMRQRTLSRPGCRASALGGPWLALTCGTGSSQTFQLYNIPAGQFQAFTATAPYQLCTINCVPIVGVGTDWVVLEAPPGDYHVFPSFEFQNLKTGATTPDPTSSTTTINLNSPRLAAKVCRPLSVPAVSNGYSSGWGSLTFDDGFAIASGDGGAYLERCGSHLHDFLTFTTPNYGAPGAGCPHLDCSPPANSHAIVWQSAAGRLSGIFLPSRQRFTIPIPANVDPNGASGGFANGDMYTLALTPSRLYLLNQQGQIWSIPAPIKPSSNRRHRG